MGLLKFLLSERWSVWKRCSKGNWVWQPSCQKWEKKKKEFNYLGHEVAENEQLAKKKMIINMTDAHLLYISVVHRT